MGATATADGVRFRVWAPAARRVEVELTEAGRCVALEAEHEHQGIWSTQVADARGGTRYRFRLNGQASVPDPYSRSQPEGVHGPSAVVDPNAFEWHDAEWRGHGIKGLVVYQAHVGAATPEGTFDSLVGQLPRLKTLGVSAVEPLPVAEFPGRRNWGYDGVDLFAVSHVYGGPEALKRFVDAAHQHDLAVILDVVYNHFGPDGNYLRELSSDYFTDRYQTPWGEAINYDGPRSELVRKLVIDNARFWIHEYHADGLRLDATHAIFDRSKRHLVAELTETVRASVHQSREIVLIAETSENDVGYVKPLSEGGFGLDAVWADDFHHTLRRYLTGDHEGYYADYVGTLDEVAKCIEQGWLYVGQPTPSSGMRRKRGTPTDNRPAWHFIFVLQNHDQVGNRAIGERLNHQIDPDRFRAASTLLLFLPYTPMLFMGQEFGASTPFQYFTDHNPELGKLVTEGRRKEFQAFSAFADPASRERIPDPQAEATFVQSKLRLDEIDSPSGSDLQALHRALLRLRRTDPVLASQDRGSMEARALTPDVLAVRRWRAPQDTGARGADTSGHALRERPDGSERLLLVNFGDADTYVGAYGGSWRVLLSSGASAHANDSGVTLQARTAVVLARGGV